MLDFHRRPALGGLREQPGNNSWVILRWPKSWINPYDHTIHMRAFVLHLLEGMGVGGQWKSERLCTPSSTRCMGETVATHELSHLVEDGGVASGRTCQSLLSICERFKGSTFGGDVLKEGGAGQSDSAQPVTTPLLHGLHHMFQSMQASVWSSQWIPSVSPVTSYPSYLTHSGLASQRRWFCIWQNLWGLFSLNVYLCVLVFF